MVIIIKNKSEIPYGVLNSGYNDGLNIHNNIWNNVVDYVTNDYGRITEPYNTNFRKLWTSIERDVMNKALQKGIDAKSAVDLEFEGLLLSSESRPILYLSEDSYLGVDFSTHVGDNIYGKWLTNYRNIIMENNSDVFYNVYVLDRLLKTAINYEPLDTYLQLARNGAGIKTLINVLSQKYQNMVDMPSREIVEETRHITTRNFTSKAEEIILNVMKLKIREVRVRNLSSYSYKIFTIFVKNAIKKHNLNYDADKFISLMDKDERNYSVDRVYEAYTKKVLSDEIQLNTPDVYIPTSEDVKNVEMMQIQGYVNNLPVANEFAIVDSRTSRLGLKDDRVIFTVDNRNFPTISHFIVYELGKLIRNFDSYNMIVKDENTFYRLEESKKYLNDNMAAFKNDYFNNRLKLAINTKILQHSYLIDYMKSMGDDLIEMRDFMPSISTAIYRELKDSISWRGVLQQTGDVIDYIDSDSFFAFIQKEMFESFVEILKTVTPDDLSYNNVVTVYQQFYGTIPGTISKNLNDVYDIENIQRMSESLNINFSENSMIFLKRKFIERILMAEELAQNLFGDSKVLFLTKFLIINSRYRIFKGEFIDPNRIYTNKGSKEALALSKVLNAISVCTNFKVVTESHIDKAFCILNSTCNKIIVTNAIEPSTNLNKKVLFTGDIVGGTEPPTEGFIDNENNSDISRNEEEEATEDERDYPADDYDNYDETYDDLMYAPSYKVSSANDISKKILQYLHPSKEVKKYLYTKIYELEQSETKNMYRINLWQ